MNDPVLPEYAGNPFIARLPSPMSVHEALAALTDLPAYSPDERRYPAHLRCHCIQRLARYFDPMNRHLTLESRIGALIRQGYIGRNPNTTDFIQRLHNDHERVIQRDLHASLYPVETTASGFALIGCSGIGKSRSIDRILRLYAAHTFARARTGHFQRPVYIAGDGHMGPQCIGLEHHPYTSSLRRERQARAVGD